MVETRFLIVKLFSFKLQCNVIGSFDYFLFLLGSCMPFTVVICLVSPWPSKSPECVSIIPMAVLPMAVLPIPRGGITHWLLEHPAERRAL